MKYEDLFFEFEHDDKIIENCIEEEILSILLHDEELFSFPVKDNEGNWTTGLSVNCNDIFWWACADAENIPHNKIGELYKECYDQEGNKKKWGSVIWICLQRKMRPQHPIENNMKKRRCLG